MPDLLSPVIIVEQRELLQQHVTDAEKIADKAQRAADEARRAADEANEAAQTVELAKQKRGLLVDILQAAHLAIRRQRQATYAGAKSALLVPHSAGGQSPVTQTVICWPLNDTGEYVLAFTAKHETCIGRSTLEGKFAEMSLEEIVSLDLSVLAEMLDHLQNVGTSKNAPSTGGLWPTTTTEDIQQKEAEKFEASAEPDYSHQNNLQNGPMLDLEDVDDSDVPQGANPDIYTADTSAHVGVPESADTSASWHQGSGGR